MHPQPPPWGQIELDIYCAPMNFILQLSTPRLIIDQWEERRPWGVHLLTVPAGEHYLEVSYPWIFYRRASVGTAHVMVQPGVCVIVRYKPGWSVFSGKITILGQRPIYAFQPPQPPQFA